MTSTPNDADNPNCAKNRILLAAGRIFADKGFRCSTVREICDAADVNIASVNYYFGDKKNLYQETLLLAREIGANQFPTPDFRRYVLPRTACDLSSYCCSTVWSVATSNHGRSSY